MKRVILVLFMMCSSALSNSISSSFTFGIITETNNINRILESKTNIFNLERTKSANLESIQPFGFQLGSKIHPELDKQSKYDQYFESEIVTILKKRGKKQFYYLINEGFGDFTEIPMDPSLIVNPTDIFCGVTIFIDSVSRKINKIQANPFDDGSYIPEELKQVEFNNNTSTLVNTLIDKYGIPDADGMGDEFASFFDPVMLLHQESILKGGIKLKELFVSYAGAVKFYKKIVKRDKNSLTWYIYDEDDSENHIEIFLSYDNPNKSRAILYTLNQIEETNSDPLKSIF